MSVCRICLGELQDGTTHPACSQRLYGSAIPPVLEAKWAKLHTLGLAMVGRASISGVQRKISVGLSADRTTLQVALPGGRYIVKPPSDAYPFLPENEHLSMRLAASFGIAVPEQGLIDLDGRRAYIVTRFDRPPEGGKCPQEDFCQLAEKPLSGKYDGSAELCARIIRRYAAEPGIEMLKLYRILVFAWWIGNGDLHLKNLSLYDSKSAAPQPRLTPAYDLLNTRLLIDGDPLALPVGGRRDRLTRKTWLQFAAYCGIPARAAERVLRAPSRALPACRKLVARSFLPEDMQSVYAKQLTVRAAALGE